MESIICPVDGGIPSQKPMPRRVSLVEWSRREFTSLKLYRKFCLQNSMFPLRYSHAVTHRNKVVSTCITLETINTKD